MKISMRSLMGSAVALAMLGTAFTSQAGVSDKVLNVGCEGAFAPFTFIDKNGQITGFDIDLIRQIGSDLGYKVNVRVYPFDGLIPALLTDGIDVIISGFTISPERAKKVDFSDPYYLCGLTYLTQAKHAEKFKDYIKLDGEKLCVQIGTTGAMFAQKHFPNAQLRQFNSPPETYLELERGGCAAVINDMPVNDFFLSRHQDGTKFASAHIDKDVDKEYYGIAVNKNHPEMLKEINRGLKLVQQNGNFAKISTTWFGYDITDTLKQ